MIDASASSFERDVIEASHSMPVLVDFWAPWCGPCRILGPLLERLELAYAGRLRVVKINSDQEPGLAAQFAVRSIPYVVAFVDGQPVDSFVGVLPERELRAFVDRLLPNPAEIERRKAARLQAAGDTSGAAHALRAALVLEPNHDATRWALAQLLIDAGGSAALAEAASVLGGASKAGQGEARHRALALALSSRQRAADLPAADALAARVAADGSDLPARLELAQWHVGRREFDAALEQLLAIAALDRSFGDDVGRRTALAVFDLMADQPAAVSAWRRRLASVLNR
jgi:putative thioredoxin